MVEHLAVQTAWIWCGRGSMALALTASNGSNRCAMDSSSASLTRPIGVGVERPVVARHFDLEASQVLLVHEAGRQHASSKSRQVTVAAWLPAGMDDAPSPARP